MNDAHETLETADQREVLFSSKYGSLPRFFWYGVVPFLLLASSVLFVRAMWFNEGVSLGPLKVHAGIVAYVICPLLVGMCGLLLGAEIYNHRNPQFIVVTDQGVRLPKRRLTSETVFIAWDNLRVDLEGKNLTGWHVYDLTFTDEGNDATASISSMLFRDFDDFATLTLIMADHMGQDWTIKGFWPGTIRDRRKTDKG